MLAAYPLCILAIEICTVLGLIIVFRINAFIALITAAIVVSLLAAGAPQDKISRVAVAFGKYAGNIGIVIALAAVIGKCMMDSGAADRVVRSFLNLLGEKRAPVALMGSGFVLAVPVFFDTVFYLLVPLARSLYRKTSKNYVMYILAIAAGGAITHTLVPPTPGPLIMAANLNVDLGTMIIIGALVALPAAIAGLWFGKLMDRKLEIPMRSNASIPEPDPLADDQLPSLFMSLLPVILPVLMIATNTVLSTLADGEQVAYLQQADITDWNKLQQQLTVEENSNSPAAIIMQSLDDSAPELAAQFRKQAPQTAEQKQQLLTTFNRMLADKSFYSAEYFQHVLQPSWKVDAALKANPPAGDVKSLARMQLVHKLLAEDRVRMKKVTAVRMNRLLLEIAFPGVVRPHVWETSLRAAANISGLFGNANLALLVSTMVAMFVLWQQRRPTFTELAMTVELSLMSGGAIILITAAGGAFGAMLAVAKVGDAILEMFGTDNSAGMLFIFLGFAIAALMKVAQGSSTTAMIVVSGMLAAPIAGVELGYHPVYVATAIGAGSLVGSWMNDSGFWIFAKMSGLTEVEALKTWTPLLLILAAVSLGMTVVLAIILPQPLSWM